MTRGQNDIISREYAKKLILVMLRNRMTRQERALFEELLQLVEKAPAVDSVKVVRCRDCAFGRVYADYMDNRQMRCVLTELETVPTGYCHHGEEKTDGGDS